MSALTVSSVWLNKKGANVGNHRTWDRTARPHHPEGSAHPVSPFSLLMREAVFTHPAAKDPRKQQPWTGIRKATSPKL